MASPEALCDIACASALADPIDHLTSRFFRKETECVDAPVNNRELLTERRKIS
ncbi:hypothetical protein [Rhizobium sp. 18055]|uniref:hypothetical protein n=1 Tax=Rhizobium sp. 18055 TaxID=2681403 RepID=UPI001359840D|nr:hypothetical protein [Rhizobium sp. 18055]